jgi:ribokinase
MEGAILAKVKAKAKAKVKVKPKAKSKAKGRSRVVVVGSSNTDLTMLVADLPTRGQTSLGSEIYSSCGGKGANQAVAAARAGADVSLIAAIGDDDFGASVLACLKKEGIDTKHVMVKKGKTSGVALLLVDEKSGENQIGVVPGANSDLRPADVEKAAATIRKADVLLLQLEIPLATAARAASIAKKAGVKVVLNPAPMPRPPVPRNLMSCIDVVVPNQGELVRLASKASERMAAERLFRSGVTSLVITLGSKGARTITDAGIEQVPSFRVRAIDTVGAGDCFCGYLATGLAEGKKLEEAALLASAAGAISVTKRGAQPSMPRRTEAEKLAKTAANRRTRRRH